eukprot:gene1740-33150_t
MSGPDYPELRRKLSRPYLLLADTKGYEPRSRSFASKTNGGKTTFPYCGCYEASCGVKVDSFVVSDPSDEVQQLSFRITADANCPRTNRKCSQDLRKIEINSFDYCRWTRMDVSLNGNFLPYNFDNQGMQDDVPGVQILKLYGLTLTYADLAAAPATINITLHPERDGTDRQCPTFEQMLNTTATPGSPISAAFFSSNLNPPVSSHFYPSAQFCHFQLSDQVPLCPHTCIPLPNSLGPILTTSPFALPRGAPYYVSEPVAVGTTFNFTIVQDASGCTDFQPKAGGPPSSCCQMSIDKIEMVINPECRGEIKTISVNGQARSSSYSNSSYINMPEFTPAGYPDPQPWYQIFKITKLASFSGDLDILIEFRTPECSAAGTLFPNGLMWYAFFSGQQYRSNCCVLLPAPGVSSQNRPLEFQDCAVLINYLDSGGCAEAPLPGLGEFICTMEPQVLVVDGRNLSMMSVCAAGDTDANAWLASIDDVCAATILAGGLDYTEQCDIILEAASSCGGPYRFSQQCQLAEVDFPHSCYPGNSAFNGGRGTGERLRHSEDGDFPYTCYHGNSAFNGGAGTGERLRGAPYYVSEPVAVGTTFNFTIVQDASGCTDFQPKAGGPPSSCCKMSIDKIEMVINPECRGEIKTISVNGQARSSSYSNSSYINMPEFTPAGYPDP